jgi:5-dehydro-4-deoxyglucarate dehydratase
MAAAVAIQTPGGQTRRHARNLAAHLRGALAFPITPFGPNGSVDLAAVRANAGWLASSGIGAIVTPSGTGEIFALTPDECEAIVRATVAVAGTTPVIAGVGFGPRVAADLAAKAEAAGASGVMVMPPYYAQPDPAGLIAYYRAVADATSLGLVPYARDAAHFTPPLLERLVREVPSVVALKDGRGDVRLFQQLREHVVARLGPDRMVWLAGVGDDLVGPYFAAGAEGFTSSLACFWPEASLELFRLASGGDLTGLAEFHARVVRPIYDLRQRRRGYEVAVMKAAMELLGHPAGPVRPPLAELTAEDREELRRVLNEVEAPPAAARWAPATDAGQLIPR